MLSPSKRQLLPYAIVVLFGYIGFSLPLPILPEMFLDPERAILPATYTLQQKAILLGFIIAGYPLGQLFGCPLLGRLSDRYGRKKIIIISLAGSAIGYLITSGAAAVDSVWGIFFGLLFCGFCEGNIAIAQAVIADTSTKETKTAHFGLINLFVTLGFIIGPLAGGKLADPSFVSWFTFATPFWMAAIMTCFGIVIILLYSKESRREVQTPEIKVALFKRPDLRVTYVANFFLALAFTAFWRFLPVYLEQRFDFSSSMLGYVMAYDAIAFGLALLFFIKPLAARITPQQAFIVFTLLFGIFLTAIALPNSPYALWFTIPPIGLCLSLAMTNASVLVSDAAGATVQGKAMGTLQSVHVFAEVLTGIGGGFLAAEAAALPLFIGSAMAFVSAIILFASIRFFRVT